MFSGAAWPHVQASGAPSSGAYYVGTVRENGLIIRIKSRIAKQDVRFC